MNYLIILVPLVAIFETAADIFFKEWSIRNNYWLLASGIVLYGISTLVWAISLKYLPLSKAIIIFSVITIITIVLTGVIFYKEELSLLSIVGIALGIISIVLLEWE